MAKKHSIFEQYSRNFALVRKIFQDVDTQLGKTIAGNRAALLCPLCFHVLNSDNLLANGDPKELTVEHVPPDSLGGKGEILLCRECNSRCGEGVDSALYQFFKVQPFHSGKVGASVEVKTMLEANGKSIGATVEMKIEGRRNFHLNFKLKPKGDDYRQKVVRDAGADFKLHIHGEIPSQKFIRIALLKVAFEIAFKTFGHSFVLAGGYANVRDQILNPAKSILPCFGLLQTLSIPFDEGLYIVPQPVDLKCLMVVFQIKHNGEVEKCAVLLPPPHTDDVAFYWELFKYERREFRIHEWRRFNDLDFLCNSDYVEAYLKEFQTPYKLNLNRLGLDFL